MNALCLSNACLHVIPCGNNQICGQVWKFFFYTFISKKKFRRQYCNVSSYVVRLWYPAY